MGDRNPFISIMELEPLNADLAPKAASDVSYSDIVNDSSGWLPTELLDAFSILESAGFDIAAIARNLSVILALLRGELKSRPAIQRWFSTGQVEVSQGQIVYLSSIGRLAREIRRISTKIADTNVLKEEKIAEFREASGKRQEKAGATLDRLEVSTKDLEARRRKATLEFEELINLVADYLGVGGMK